MTPDANPSDPERILHRWPVRFVGSADSPAESGELVLTERSLRFEPRRGIFSRSRAGAMPASALLETIGEAGPYRTVMRIGYGDRMIVEGATFAGRNYEFGRELTGRAVLTEVALTRAARRKELGLPNDRWPCPKCGRWVSTGPGVCGSCGGSARTTG